MLLLSKADIKKVFTMKDAVEADKEAFRLVVEGKCDAPIRTNIQAPKHEGSFLFYAGLCGGNGHSVFKSRRYFPTQY